MRGTKPKVGRSPVVPQRVEGDEMEPSVSEPMAKATQPEAVAEAYWQIYQEPRDAWSFEREIRPFSEKW